MQWLWRGINIQIVNRAASSQILDIVRMSASCPARRYTEVGSYNGTPRYRNPNNVLLFRHELKPSEELGITRQTCSSDNEMTEKDGKSVVMGLKASMEGEVPSSMSMNFAWLVKNSLQTINLDRQARQVSDNITSGRVV